MRDVNKGLQFELDDLKQKLNDANGDIKVSAWREFRFFLKVCQSKKTRQRKNNNNNKKLRVG